MVLARTLFFFELTTFSRELAHALFGGSFTASLLLLFILELLPRFSFEFTLRSTNSIIGFALSAALIESPFVAARLDLVSLLARTLLVLDHSDKLEMVLALTDLFFVELITASLDRLASPKFSFEQQALAQEEFATEELAKEERLSWNEDRWLATLLRFALLFLMFSRELETDFGGSMLSRLLPNPGSDN
jgi:hypothetical protein